MRQKRVNAEAHLQGMYVYDAILRASPMLHAFSSKGTKPLPYPAEPYKTKDDIEKEQKDEALKAKKEESERLQARLYMEAFVRAGKDWGKNKKKKQPD